MDVGPTKGFPVHVLSVTYAQEEDTASPRSTENTEQRLTVETNPYNDSWQNPYFAISTERWAFNDLDELVRLLELAGARWEGGKTLAERDAGLHAGARNVKKAAKET